MPPRENPRVNKSVDSVYASGPLGRVHRVVHGNSNYKQTGLLQAFAAYSLLQKAPLRAGFASACQAFGYRDLLGTPKFRSCHETHSDCSRLTAGFALRVAPLR
jgi:hypothetical protein